MQRANWSQPDQLNDQPPLSNGPFMDDSCLISQQPPPQQIPPQQPPTTGRRSKKQQNQSHVSPISQNSSTLNSPNPIPNIAPSPNRQNPPPYSPVNSMRLPPYGASPSPSTPSSIDSTMLKNNTNSPKSMQQHLNQQQLGMGVNSNNLDQQLNAPLSPVTKKCKNTPDPLVDNDCFNSMNSSLPNNSNKQAICKINSSNDPHLMPVPSPHKIQYLPGFEGHELIIQKVPNNSIPPDSEPTGSNTDLDFINIDFMNNQSTGPPLQPHLHQQQTNLPPNTGGPPISNQQPPQFMNRMPPMNNASFNGPPPPHLQIPPSQMINQQPPNQMMSLDNSSNSNNLVPNQPRFNSNNQFDPRQMQPHPSFCSNQGPPPQNPNIPPNGRFDMYGPPGNPNMNINSRMAPQQFKSHQPNQLIGGPLITNDYNSPLNEPPMGSNHLQVSIDFFFSLYFRFNSILLIGFFFYLLLESTKDGWYIR